MEKFTRDPATERTDTLVWGKNPVTELLKSGGAVDTVYLTDSIPQPVAGYYTALAKECGAVVKRVPANKLQKMCGTAEHQGVAARPPCGLFEKVRSVIYEHHVIPETLAR